MIIKFTNAIHSRAWACSFRCALGGVLLLSGCGGGGGSSSAPPVSTVSTPATSTAAVTPSEIVVFANQPLYTMHGGYGANVTAISTSIAAGQLNTRIGSANCLLPEASDNAKWNSIFQFMNWSGLDWIRLYMEMNDYEPEKNKFTWDSPNFLRLLKILEWAKTNNVDVFLQQQDQATTWNTIPGQNPGNSAPNDLKAFADGFATMVDYLVNTRGYTNIKYINISNEADNWWGWWKGGLIQDGNAAVRAALDARNISIPLAGTEYFEGVKDDKGNVNLDRYNFNWEANKQYLGAWESHDYAQSQQGIIAARPIDDQNYPVFWGEFGGSDNTNYDWDITVAKWFVGSPANGIDGYARWSYLNQNDIDGDFSFIRTYDKTTKKLLDVFTPTHNLYWIDGIVSRFTAKYSIVHATSRTQDKITTGFFKSPNGQQTLIVVNEDKSNNYETKFTFQGLDKDITLYRYEVTPVNVKDKLSGVTINSTANFSVGPNATSFNDRVIENSVTIYTTYNLAHADAGIVADGNFTTVSTPTALASHSKILDNKDSSITYSGTWQTKAEDVAHHASSLVVNDTAKAFFQFEFTGTHFRLYGQQDRQFGLGSVYVDDRFVGYANYFAPFTRAQMMTFDSGLLTNQKHTVKVVNEGKKAITSVGTSISLDAVAFE